MILPTILLQRATHNNTAVVCIRFSRNEEVLQLLRPLRVQWSKTMGSWYLPFREGMGQEFSSIFKGIAYIDYKDLLIPIVQTSVTPQLPVLSLEAMDKLHEFKNWLSSKRYSSNTIATYTDALQTFLRFHADKPLNEISNNDVIIFNNDYILKRHFSASFQNQVVNAIKLFFNVIENAQLDPQLIHRPKRPKLLPNVLSKQEVKQILGALSNIKHRAMLSLIYSCGLRRSELLNLKINDVDSKRYLLIVRQSKGRKDRIAPLSEKILVVLRDYYTAYKPKVWLFEGQDKSGRYDESSLGAVLHQAVAKCGISKPVTLHWLRHSYATHLLENGTDLRYIQEILGHSRSTTTEIYTHVSNKSIQKIVSPFDSL